MGKDIKGIKITKFANVPATRIIEWDAGHRVYKHEGKCAHVHGHRYRAEITAQAELDDIGRVIDFGILKERVGGWIDTHWDHGMLLTANDPLVQVWPMLPVIVGDDLDTTTTWSQLDHKHFIMPNNPTAENIATFIGEQVAPECLEGTGVNIVAVRVWETPNCYADWRIV